MNISVKLLKNKDRFIATCPELEISCYASSQTEAKQRIKDVISFYLHSAKEMGLEVESFDSVMINGKYSGPISPLSIFETGSYLN
ncbi:MAG: hypothetical protein JXR90_07005 [Spirochaetes bacterium]|nr:hypothetical protein [Sedimentisphaerales bacterium]MBN2770426.1 hypothetical protein [Spirochaetota bacterium]